MSRVSELIEPGRLTLPAGKTALAVLDLSLRCDEDVDDPCWPLVRALGGFLDRARAAGVLVLFTVSLNAIGTRLGDVSSLLRRHEREPLISPDGFDKFTGGELRTLLAEARCEHLVIVGSLTNICVMYTATTALRNEKLDVVIPVDAVRARCAYEQEYALHQLQMITEVAADVTSTVRFTTTEDIAFEDG